MLGQFWKFLKKYQTQHKLITLALFGIIDKKQLL